MTYPRWEEAKAAWEPDGALRDVWIADTDERDWQRVVEALRATNWETIYSEDGRITDMPANVSAVFEARRDRSTMWQLRPGEGIHVNCHFFGPDEIEFDFDPREVRDQSSLDVVCGFMRLVGAVLGKPVCASWENVHDADAFFLRYDPAKDRVANEGAE